MNELRQWLCLIASKNKTKKTSEPKRIMHFGLNKFEDITLIALKTNIKYKNTQYNIKFKREKVKTELKS